MRLAECGGGSPDVAKDTKGLFRQHSLLVSINSKEVSKLFCPHPAEPFAAAGRGGESGEPGPPVPGDRHRPHTGSLQAGGRGNPRPVHHLRYQEEDDDDDIKIMLYC